MPCDLFVIYASIPNDFGIRGAIHFLLCALMKSINF